MQYYTIDKRGVLLSGPVQITDPKAPLPRGAVVTDQEPPTPGEGEAVMWSNGWRLASQPAPVIPPPPRKPVFTHYRFATEILTADQNDAWLALIEAARTAIAAGTATAAQRAQFRAYTHFNLAGAVDMNAAETQAGVMAMYVWGVFGPVYDPDSGVNPTPEELAAIAEADRVAAGQQPDDPA